MKENRRPNFHYPSLGKIYDTIQEAKLLHKDNLRILKNTVFTNRVGKRDIRIQVSGGLDFAKVEILNADLLNKSPKEINKKLRAALNSVFDQLSINYAELHVDAIRETFSLPMERFWIL